MTQNPSSDIHTLRKQIGTTICQARRAKAMSQRTLSTAARIHQCDLSQIENGETSLGPHRAKRIAEALNIDPDTINIRKLAPQSAAATAQPITPAVQPASAHSPRLAGLPKTQSPDNAPTK